MIVWLASYPRSGNTYFRILLKQLFDMNTSTAYVGNDFTAFEVGKELVGHVAEEWTIEEMASQSQCHIVKTHRRASDNYPAIYLHRDGRDSIVSYARKKANEGSSYREALKKLITTSTSSTGTWGQNVLHWLNRNPENTIFVSYEDLITRPEEVIEQTLNQLQLDMPFPRNRRSAPTFEELQTVNNLFFRRGTVGSHKNEMPDDLHDLFWQQPEHSEAMRLLGYAR